MGIIQGTINTAKRMFGVRQLADNFKFVKNYSEEVITSELHASAKGRKPITESEAKLISTYGVFKKLCITYLVIAALSVLYSIYHFVHHRTVPGVLSLGFCLLCLSFSFRYNFWMLQIRRRELGCTFRDWLNSVTGKGA